MQITELYLKPTPRAPMVAMPALDGEAGHGLVGDCAAHRASPRHALLVAESDLSALGVSARDLRVNIVVRGDLCNLTSGSIITFGLLSLRITFPCEPCGKLDRVRPGLRREMGERRLLAVVHSSGQMSVGDRGEVVAERGPVMSSDWKERVLAIAAEHPTLSHAELARAAGVVTAYCRAFPRLLGRP